MSHTKLIFVLSTIFVTEWFVALFFYYKLDTHVTVIPAKCYTYVLEQSVF